MKGLLSSLLASAFLSGCVSLPKPPDSRIAWEAIHQREFVGKNERELLEAAEKVLRLSDKDFVFDYPEGALLGTRKWLAYGVIVIVGGTDYWRITARPTSAGTRLTVEISRKSQSTTAAPVVGGGGVYGVNSSSLGEPIFYRAPYDLFWSRMQHLLTGDGQWVTCKQFKDGKKSAEKAGIDVLCSVTTDDEVPVVNG